MGVALSTAGVLLGYAVETTAGTRPTGSYTKIPDIKSVPELNPEPSSLDSTTLEATEYKTSTSGLKDLGGSVSFGANYTQELKTSWKTLVEAYKTAKADGKAVWFEVWHPELAEAVFFTGEPSAQGLPAMEVDSILETNCYITVTNEPADFTAVKPA